MVVSGPGFESVPQPSSECGVSGDGGSEVVVGVKGQTPPTDRGDGDETRGGKVYSKLRETCLLCLEYNSQAATITSMYIHTCTFLGCTMYYSVFHCHPDDRAVVQDSL